LVFLGGGGCVGVLFVLHQASDFAFGQFRFLVRLLLLHGRQSYLRCREVVLYAFYKNVAYVSCYIFFSVFSGAPLGMSCRAGQLTHSASLRVGLVMR
jgi:P-type E1-E2 ATPase